MEIVDPYDAVIRAFTAIWDRHRVIGFDHLAEPERVIFCTWQFVGEVNNGGFHQYFVNPAGEFTCETVTALELISMPFAASLLRRAIGAFPNKFVPKDHRSRSMLVWQMPPVIQEQFFDELTGLFYDSDEDPYRLQATYIERHRDAFPGLPKG